MKPLYTEEEYESASSRDLLKLKCYQCDSDFLKRKSLIKRVIEGKEQKACRFCSSKCVNLNRTTHVSIFCETCNKEFKDRPTLNRKFCSKSCSAKTNNLGRIHSEESKTKRSKKLRGRKISSNPAFVTIACLECDKKFNKRYGKRFVKFCSKECVKKNPEVRKKLSQKGKERVANGTHNGWASRSIISYPEQFFMNVFKENKIENYQHNKKVGKYFLDFAFDDLKLDVEIDGKQHNLPERKIADKERDEFLESEGWKVYRISWKSVNTDDGRQYIKEEINKLMDIIL